MKSTQAWGWLAAGMLAAGLNAAYHDGGLAWAHRIADQAQHVSGAVVALASGRADQFLAEAQMLTARNGAYSDATLAKADHAMAQVQAAYARAEAFQARGQARCARIRAEHARIQQRIAAPQALLGFPEAEIVTAYRTIEIPGVPGMSATRIEIPQVCSRVRVNLPRVDMPQIPAIQIPAINGIVATGSAE